MSQYVIPAAASVIVAVIEALAALDRKKAEKSREIEKVNEKRRTEEAQLSMKMASATLLLSVVTANALTGGHNNGNVEHARKMAEAAQADYQEFLEKVTAQEVSK